MIKKRLLVLLGLSLLLIISASLLFFSTYFSGVANRFLPENWQISTPSGGFSANQTGIHLPQLIVQYQQCPLVALDNLSFNPQGYQLSVAKVTLDYHCFSLFPESEKDESNFSLNKWLLLAPATKLTVDELAWQNLPADLSPRLSQLLATPAKIQAVHQGRKLSLSLKQQAVEFEGDFTNGRLSGNVSYHPSETEKHNLLFTTQLNENILSLPQYFESDYHWILPENIVSEKGLQEGSLGLTWQSDNDNNLLGNLTFISETQPENKLALPFKFDFAQLEIYQGKFHWGWLPDFPINGSTTATLKPKNIMQGEIFPLETVFRMNLFSEDKHTLSLATTSGVIESPDYFILPLTLSGYVKYHGFRLFSQATIDANQSGLTFSPKSMFQIISGQERLLTIKELTIPLGTVEINRYGVSGPLQAHLKAESPDFSDIDFQLKGQARHFKMGLSEVFDDFDGKGNKNFWGWTLDGSAMLKSLNSKVKLAGKGNWHNNVIQFLQLDGEMNGTNIGNAELAPSQLKLTEPVKFFYEDWTLTGGAELSSPALSFNYGGKLPQPRAKVTFNGELETLQFKGEFQAGKVGPLMLNAKRQLKANASEFLGNIQWASQPASVFQSLIPPKINWVIKSGTVKGNTQFQTQAQKGLVASGEISITDAGLSLPKGEINGIEFTFPFRLSGDHLTFGQRKPIAVKIAEINAGVPIQNVHLNIDGHYPYSQKQPLNLRKLELDLLDGKLKVEHFALPQVKVALLQLENIRFERLMEVANYQQIDLRGKANATLPFWLSGEPCYICDGRLEQTETSYLKISDALMKAISQSSGYSERILLYLLNDTKVTDMATSINVPKSGDMKLAAQLKLQLNQQEKAKVNFNYTHQENIFGLWSLMNAASNIEQQIENHIYQKLDNNK